MNLCNKVRQHIVGNSSNDHADFNEESFAFAKFANYIKSKYAKDVMNVKDFKRAELQTLYKLFTTIYRGQLIDAKYATPEHPEYQVVKMYPISHSPRLKERLQIVIMCLSVHHLGRNVVFIADAEMAKVVYQDFHLIILKPIK